MNDADFPVARVLEGIDAAAAAGLGPVKVNMVVKRGTNDQEVLPMARRFRGTGHVVRFIEFMDVGSTNGWRLDDVVPSAEVVRRIGEHFALEQADPNYAGEVAERWRYADGAGEIGVIASVSSPFCSSCTRARLTLDGSLVTCLFATGGTELRTSLRSGAGDDELRDLIRSVWRARSDRYSEERASHTDLDGHVEPRPKIEMYHIGG